METKSVLILGSGHLANRTNSFIRQMGYEVTHIPNLTPNLPSADSSTISEIEEIFHKLNMKSFTMTYVLFEKDEDNLEIVIALMSLYATIPISTSLFNENLRPHLEKANSSLTILNPAKLVAPLFVRALNEPVTQGTPKRNKHISVLTKKTKYSFLSILVALFTVIVFSSVVYFHYSEHLSWLDAIYFVIVTIATVGYGDINLLNSSSLSKLIGIVLILCSTTFIWLIFSLLIDKIIKREAQRSAGRKKVQLQGSRYTLWLGSTWVFYCR